MRQHKIIKLILNYVFISVTNLCNQKQIVRAQEGHRKLLSTLSTHTWTSQTGATHQNVPSFHGTLAFPAKCMQHNSCKAANLIYSVTPIFLHP